MTQTRPNIVIVCRNAVDGLTPFNNDYYIRAYSDLLLAVKRCGANVYFSSREHYMGDGLFDKAYTMDAIVPFSQFTLTTDIRADLAYDKGDFSDIHDVTTLNPIFVHTITSNKSETYAHFGAYQPVSRLCQDEQEMVAALGEVPGDMIVIKPLTGNGGHGVLIVKREDIDLTDSTFVAEYPVLVQEFLDTACGIPGMVEGIHDLRIKTGNGEVWGGTLRTPREGELRANVAQGGTERHLFPEEIPEDAVAIAMAIDQHFTDYPRYYSIDLARTERGWKLIELNSKPGLSPVDMSKQATDITERLAQYLVRLATDQLAQR